MRILTLLTFNEASVIGSESDTCKMDTQLSSTENSPVVYCDYSDCEHAEWNFNAFDRKKVSSTKKYDQNLCNLPENLENTNKYSPGDLDTGFTEGIKNNLTFSENFNSENFLETDKTQPMEVFQQYIQKIRNDMQFVQPDIQFVQPNMQLLQHDIQVFHPDIQVFHPDMQVVDRDINVFQSDTNVFQSDTNVFQSDTNVFQSDTNVLPQYMEVISRDINVIHPDYNVFPQDMHYCKQYSQNATTNIKCSQPDLQAEPQIIQRPKQFLENMKIYSEVLHPEIKPTTSYATISKDDISSPLNNDKLFNESDNFKITYHKIQTQSQESILLSFYILNFSSTENPKLNNYKKWLLTSFQKSLDLQYISDINKPHNFTNHSFSREVISKLSMPISCSFKFIKYWKESYRNSELWLSLDRYFKDENGRYRTLNFNVVSFKKFFKKSYDFKSSFPITPLNQTILNFYIYEKIRLLPKEMDSYLVANVFLFLLGSDENTTGLLKLLLIIRRFFEKPLRFTNDQYKNFYIALLRCISMHSAKSEDDQRKIMSFLYYGKCVKDKESNLEERILSVPYAIFCNNTYWYSDLLLYSEFDTELKHLCPNILNLTGLF